MTQEQWEYSSASEAEELKPYSGPTDPEYHNMPKKQYETSLAHATEKLKHYMEKRP